MVGLSIDIITLEIPELTGQHYISIVSLTNQGINWQYHTNE